MRDHEIVHERDKPPAVARTVARSVLDDVKDSLFTHEEKRAKREPAFTKQDFDQALSLAAMPVALGLNDVRPGPDVTKAGPAAARLGPAAAALKVMASHKRDPIAQANMLLPVPDIEAAQTTLQVMSEGAHAQQIWTASFRSAMTTIDSVIALPVQQEDEEEPSPDSMPPRDHELMVASLKPAMQRLVEASAGEPYVDWNPKTFTEGQEVLSALGAFSSDRLTSAKEAVAKGLQAIKAFAMTLEEQNADAIEHLEAAQRKLSQQAEGYFQQVAEEHNL